VARLDHLGRDFGNIVRFRVVGHSDTREPINQAFLLPCRLNLGLLWEKGTLFERETIRKLDRPFLDLSKYEASEKERLTLDAMRTGEPLIYGGRISADDLVGEPDLLRKETGGYIPGDIKSGAGLEGDSGDDDGKPKLHYAVQLALYIDVLERLRLSAGRRAFVWDIHGDEIPYDFTSAQGPRKPETLWDEYHEALADARAILNKDVFPTAAYGGVCKLCHWYTHCLKELTEADDLTLIPFLGRKVRDAMRDHIPTIADFAAANPDAFINGKKTRFSGLGVDRLRLFHARAVMLAHEMPTPYLRAPVVLRQAPVELFFDIEDDPMRDIVYLHGIVERQDGSNDGERYVCFFADEVSADAERQAFAAAYSYLTQEGHRTIYYYSKHERTKYRQLQKKYPDVCTPDDIEKLFEPPEATDLYFDVVFPATEWPTRDHSLKTLAKYLGFEWRDAHPSGAASIEWFDRWCRDRDLEVKQRILDYNEDDCRATRVLLDGIRALTASPN
jgi:predicted RecB family nuclease